MVVSVNIVLEKYASVLNGSLSYSEADRWAWEMMQLFDGGKLEFEPKENEELIWQLIQYLYGIDIPSVSDRTKTMISDLDIIEFLKEKNVYNLF
ncbi:hypothetical protein ACFU8T_04605 [Sphingobacterium spiritivorum]|uniref:Uncharacterized protein n=1 Tax=Sphingobacterium spiritivorum ATCC 33861 TaxID=525373 RepID=D7VQG7_SPHSI|nr:hypothetical protein [Sphingobacterium spiritivorum]EFK56018.1 hypothetical protein HMPREF0766_13221 [Sphingobacterium spiritivorum ATCC 33861]QQT35850.1 hypothetical protein I6J01_00045 [Sphingobacterium spiritivorum]WQD32576.1 hypothetical protein U0038_13745 [Sphingobacterium spiritivorum]SUJ11179.1 Uncharacterised protein [Sphingobacterium spiritivorum]